MKVEVIVNFYNDYEVIYSTWIRLKSEIMWDDIGSFKKIKDMEVKDELYRFAYAFILQ